MGLPEEFKPTQRYTILRRLGAGGMGVVYEALDNERDVRVALKTLRAPDESSLLRFKSEFRSLADIGHKNLITLFDLVSDQGKWFFTMELVAGADFLSWVRPGVVSDSISDASGETVRRNLADTIAAATDATGSVLGSQDRGRLDAPRLRSAFLQLALGLSALHAAGTVHRDLKPTNVTVTPQGRVVILDFGLATDSAARGPHSGEAIVGTVAYMAPEQAAGIRVGPEADWYAAGVMLYEALTGVLPYQGSAFEVMSNKQRDPPTPPHRIDVTAPDDLSALCMQLLSIEPSARPSAADVLSKLGSVTGRSSLAPAAGNFVGRDRELVALGRAYEDVRRGTGVTIYVHGESGVGKTALVRHFLTKLAARDSDTLILPGRCYERESVPFKAIDGVIDALARQMMRMPKGEASAIMPLRAATLGHAFPVLKRFVPVNTAPPPSSEPSQMRAQVLAALRETFQRLAARTCVALLIDDLQWADADSLLLLREIMRPPDAPALLLIATVRTTATLSAQSMPASRLNVGSSIMPGDVRVIAVERLPADDARALAELLFRRASGATGELTQARASTIAEEAGGHPLFIDELVRHSLGDSTAAPATSHLKLEEALWARIVTLDPVARALVIVACYGGTPLDHAVAADAAGIKDQAEYDRIVAALRSAHLLRTTQARGEPAIEPYHDRVRQALLLHTRLDVTHDAAAIHARIAGALTRGKSTDYELLAQQTKAAGDLESAAHHAERAAEHAASVLAFERAARLFREAIDLGNRPESDAERLHVRIGDMLVAAGRGAEAAAAYEQAATFASEDRALDLRMQAGTQLLVSGRIDAGLELITKQLSSLDLPSPASVSRASLLLQRARLAVRGYSFTPRLVSKIPSRELRRIDACYSLSMGLSAVDPRRAMAFQSRGILLALDAGDPVRVARALTLEIGLTATAGYASRPKWSAIVGEARKVLDVLMDPHASALVLGVEGVAETLCGEWAAGLAKCDAAAEVLRAQPTASAWELDATMIYALRALAMMGRVKELSRRVAEHCLDAETRGDNFLATNVRLGGMALAWLAADDPTGAQDAADDAMRRWSTTGQVQRLQELLARVDTDLYLGEGKTANLRAERVWAEIELSKLDRMQFSFVQGRSMRARTAIAWARDDSTRRRTLLDQAARDVNEMARTGAPWALANATLLRGAIAEVAGERERALVSYDHAIVELEAVDMKLHARVAMLRAGELRGGSEAQAQAREARDWMSDEEIARPDRIASVMAPSR